jgi:hypothetical protein
MGLEIARVSPSRVCVIAPGMPGNSGGVEASVARLVSYLEEWGLDWRVVCQGERHQAR